MSEAKPEKYQKEHRRIIKVKPFELVNSETTMKESSLNEEENTSDKLEQMYRELNKIQVQKAALIEETKMEIKALKENWETEKLELTKRAEQAGYTAGFKTGKQESLKQYEDILTQANTIMEAAQHDYKQTIERADEDILSLSVHIAEKIIQKKINEAPELFVSLVSGAINEVKEQTNISIYLHPDNYEQVLDQKNELIQILGKQVDLLIFIDYELNPGACVIEHPSGQIDASINTQLATIKDILQELRIEDRC